MENKSIPGSQTCLGFFGIIRESFKTTSRNGKVVGPILLLVFVSFSILDFLQKYMLEHAVEEIFFRFDNNLIKNMVEAFTHSPDKTKYTGALNYLREIVLFKLLITAYSSVITLTFMVAVVSSTYEAYTAKVLHLKDLIFVLVKSWKRPLVTSFYMLLLTLGMVFLYFITISVTTILAVNSWGLIFVGAITLSIPVCYFYVVALYIVSMVVSVLEEGISGVKAIGRAADLMKGKRLQASLMMVLFVVAYGVVYLMANVLATASYNFSRSAQVAITVPFTTGFFSLLELFMFVVYTIFYREWKTSLDDKEGKGFYLPIAAGEA